MFRCISVSKTIEIELKTGRLPFVLDLSIRYVPAKRAYQSRSRVNSSLSCVAKFFMRPIYEPVLRFGTCAGRRSLQARARQPVTKSREAATCSGTARGNRRPEVNFLPFKRGVSGSERCRLMNDRGRSPAKVILASVPSPNPADELSCLKPTATDVM